MSPSTTSNASSSANPVLAWGRLLRLSLATTAAADVFAGAVYSAHSVPSFARLWLPLLASLCVYHGGMALNDWADRWRDNETRPDRPIPAGLISPQAALAVGLVLLGLGPLLANWYSYTGQYPALLGGVSVLALLYNLAGRGPWIGPLLLGLCRAGNLLAGMAAFGVLLPEGKWLAVGYGAYVFVVSRLGRMEDGEQARVGDAPRKLLIGAGVCQLVPLIAGFAATAPLGAGLLIWIATQTKSWTRPAIVGAMGNALRLLLFYTASVAWVGVPGDPLPALGLLAVGFPLAWVLRQAFPPS
jgi:4-hydroxybenzoate polyprenyltransferase